MAKEKTILVVEDERDLVELLSYNLEREGYRCRCVFDGELALAEARRYPPDMVILDRMLPRLSGDDVMAKLRSDPKTAAVPILMLTAKAEEDDELVGFALGADDYVTKPFSMKLLLARVRALLRRPAAARSASAVMTTGKVTLDRSRHELTVEGTRVPLTATEFGILWQIMAARGRVLSREQLIDAVLGAGAVVTDRTIDVHVAALRRKLGPASSLIQTVRGVGYALREQSGASL
ncbi:MAG: response regulator transcription factor [Phycisphaerae bacterium]|jgi:two-component system phosphate regulon response regulator PhoB